MQLQIWVLALRKIRRYTELLLIVVCVLPIAIATRPLCAQAAHGEACVRPAIGSVVEEPPDVRSKDGVLEITLSAMNAEQSDGTMRYCFTDAEGRESPNLRVNPGDLVIIHLKNSMKDLNRAGAEAAHV